MIGMKSNNKTFKKALEGCIDAPWNLTEMVTTMQQIDFETRSTGSRIAFEAVQNRKCQEESKETQRGELRHPQFWLQDEILSQRRGD